MQTSDSLRRHVISTPVRYRPCPFVHNRSSSFLCSWAIRVRTRRSLAFVRQDPPPGLRCINPTKLNLRVRRPPPRIRILPQGRKVGVLASCFACCAFRHTCLDDGDDVLGRGRRREHVEMGSGRQRGRRNRRDKTTGDEGRSMWKETRRKGGE